MDFVMFHFPNSNCRLHHIKQARPVLKILISLQNLFVAMHWYLQNNRR